MTTDMIASLSLAVSAILVVAMLCGAGLAAWRGWLSLKRLELQSTRGPAAAPVADDGGETDTGTLIELAAMKERLRRLEAIASGVEL